MYGKSVAIAAIVLIPAFGAVTFWACAQGGLPDRNASQAPQAEIEQRIEVHAFGSLRTIMQEGRAPASSSLADWTPSESLVAVGALSDLRGEITAVDGKLYLARPAADGSATTTETSASEEQAGLLVLAEVPRWSDAPITEDVALDELAAVVLSIAKNAGVDVTHPFPFVLEGRFRDLRWHTIDGRRVEPGGGHDSHAQSGIREERAESGATLVGFYSDAHEGVFTHRGEHIHVHVVTEKPLSSGHLDDVVVLAGARLSVPVVVPPEP